MKTRDQIEEKYKWDLSDIYKSDEEFKKEYNEIKNEINDLQKYEKILTDNADNLYNFLEKSMYISMILEKMYVYTGQTSDEDISNNENKAKKDEVLNLYNKFSIITSFYRPTILKCSKQKLEKFYKQKSELKEYNFYIEQDLRLKNHTLSEVEEKLISSLEKSFSSTSDISNMMIDSDMDFGTFKDEKGETIELTNTNYSLYIDSKNRDIRKKVFELSYKTYKRYSNTMALALKKEIEKNSSYAKVKKYNSSLEASLYSDNVNPNVYNTLIKIVNKNMDKAYRYFKLKRKMLKLNELHFYDLYVDVLEESNKQYSFEEAKKLVFNALHPLGESYINDLNKPFDQRWIDVYPTKNKKGGGYSWGSYATNPYILLNYNGKYGDVSTLAHELGHSMHSYYSHKNNTYQDGDYKILVAEVASTVNELLLANYMLNNTNDNQEKLLILNQLLELFKGTLFRQTMFAEFEKEVYVLADKEEPLTRDIFNNIYERLIKKYFGDTVFFDEEIKYEWEKIPHFYQGFYVYKYATGISAACYIVDNITKNKNYVNKYLNFLKSGGSDYPLNELKLADVDLEKPEVVQSALDMFDNYLNEFEDLYNKLNKE